MWAHQVGDAPTVLVAPPSACGKLVAEGLEDDLVVDLQHFRRGRVVVALLFARQLDDLARELGPHPALFEREVVETRKRVGGRIASEPYFGAPHVSIVRCQVPAKIGRLRRPI